LTKRKKILLSIAPEEKSIIEWLDNQKNKNLSIRKLIKNCIEVYGTIDISELPVNVNAQSSRTHKKRRKNTIANIDIDTEYQIQSIKHKQQENNIEETENNKNTRLNNEKVYDDDNSIEIVDTTIDANQKMMQMFNGENR
jgi:hypothetical protein